MHHIETENGDSVAYPVVFLDAYKGWVRELPTLDARGWFNAEVI